MLQQAFNNIDNLLRNEAGCSTELDYTEQTSWLLILKYSDAHAHETAITGDDMRDFVEHKLFPYLRRFKLGISKAECLQTL